MCTFGRKCPGAGAQAAPAIFVWSSVTLATISGALVRSHPISSPLAQTSTPWFERLSDAAWTRIILAIAFLTYLPTINYQFVYDDTPLILLNPWMNWKSVGNLVSHHMWATATGSGYYPANFYRPIFMLWLLVWNSVGAGTPGFFHLANIMLHLVVVLLVIAITQSLTSDRATALMAGLFFALHPIHIEAVVWIAGATEVLCTAFVMGSVLAYLRSRESPDHAKSWFLLSVVSFAWAMFAKETAIVAPFALLAHACASSRTRISETLKRGALLLVPYFVVIATYIAIRVRVLGHFAESQLSSPRSAIFGFPVRFAWYLRQLCWPFRLSANYPQIAVSRLPSSLTIACLMLFLIAAVAIIWRVRRSPTWALLGTLSFLSLCPVLLENFTGFQDRYLYLPSVGFCILLAASIVKLRPSTSWLRAGIASALALTCIFTVLIEERAWDNDVSLFEQALHINRSPENFAQLAATYADRGNTPKQLALLQEGTREFPNSMVLWQKFGLYYFGKRDYDAADSAFHNAQQDAQTKPMWGWNECALGLVDYQRGNLTAAEPMLRAGLDADRNFQECRSTLALLLDRTGRSAEAQQQRAQLP
jgi:hypothetical protein